MKLLRRNYKLRGMGKTKAQRAANKSRSDRMKALHAGRRAQAADDDIIEDMREAAQEEAAQEEAADENEDAPPVRRRRRPAPEKKHFQARTYNRKGARAALNNLLKKWKGHVMNNVPKPRDIDDNNPFLKIHSYMPNWRWKRENARMLSEDLPLKRAKDMCTLYGMRGAKTYAGKSKKFDKCFRKFEKVYDKAAVPDDNLREALFSLWDPAQKYRLKRKREDRYLGKLLGHYGAQYDPDHTRSSAWIDHVRDYRAAQASAGRALTWQQAMTEAKDTYVKPGPVIDSADEDTDD